MASSGRTSSCDTSLVAFTGLQANGQESGTPGVKVENRDDLQGGLVVTAKGGAKGWKVVKGRLLAQMQGVRAEAEKVVMSNEAECCQTVDGGMATCKKRKIDAGDESKGKKQRDPAMMKKQATAIKANEDANDQARPVGIERHANRNEQPRRRNKSNQGRIHCRHRWIRKPISNKRSFRCTGPLHPSGAWIEGLSFYFRCEWDRLLCTVEVCRDCTDELDRRCQRRDHGAMCPAYPRR